MMWRSKTISNVVLRSGAQVDIPPLLTRQTERINSILIEKVKHSANQSDFVMEEIKTFVYFDLKATGLKCSGKPRITETSLIAVNYEDMLDLHIKLTEELKNRMGNKVIQVYGAYLEC